MRLFQICNSFKIILHEKDIAKNDRFPVHVCGQMFEKKKRDLMRPLLNGSGLYRFLLEIVYQ